MLVIKFDTDMLKFIDKCMKKDNYLVLLLAGDGNRLKKDIDEKKQFHLILNKPLFLYPLISFIKSNAFKKYLLVISKSDEELVKKNLQDNRIDTKDIIFIYGGKTRNESVKNAISYLTDKANDDDKIFIHDSARAIISIKTIYKLVDAINKNDFITSAFPIYDSIILKDKLEYINRDNCYRVSTPQAFSLDVIKKCYEKYDDKATDDYSKAIKLEGNYKTDIVNIPSISFKVTTIDDLIMLESIIKNNKEYQI